MVRKSGKQEKLPAGIEKNMIWHPARSKNAIKELLKVCFKRKISRIPLIHDLIWLQKSIPQALVSYSDGRVKAYFRHEWFSPGGDLPIFTR